MPLTTLPNPGMDFTPLTPLTAEEMDDIVENIEAINNATIQTGSIANGAITKAKLAQDALDNYSLSEVDTGATWIDGKKIYKKTIDCGAEPASDSSKYVPINIPNFEKAVKIEGIAFDDFNDSAPMPFAHPWSGADYSVQVADFHQGDESEWKIRIERGNVSRDFTKIYITLYYTKMS